MNLDHLYSLRRNFTVIGLTGRTGSGCSTVANLLSGSFEELSKEGLRDLRFLDKDSIFIRKFNIVKEFMSTSDNWTPFDIIKYKDVLLLYLFNKYGGDVKMLSKVLRKLYKENNRENNTEYVQLVFDKIREIHNNNLELIEQIKNLGEIKGIKSPGKLKNLSNIFFGKSFKIFSDEIFGALQSGGYYRRTNFLHYIACNIRESGDPLEYEGGSINNIYNLSNVINRLIKARKQENGDKPTRIVIDSLRNSLEIMFFRERYSAFYMLATKDIMGNSRERIKKRLPNNIKNNERDAITEKLIKLDETEYKTGDFSKGLFSSPDVENCIQKSDYHILNLKREDVDKYLDKYEPPFGKNNFLTREEQLIKLVSLISQPGLITPSSLERSMQVANTAKLNSGCISRNVGAAITDREFYVKSVGWNDVAKGHTPCNLREATDLIDKSKEVLKNNNDYSPFEKGIVSPKSSYKYKGQTPGNFKEALSEYFKEGLSNKKEDLKGKNCAFCFKTVHNHYEGEANQVHTRSLHAEENAMLQITKLGGQGVKHGILFTTASPCELCSKKAYQLGIETIYYIDPYPGISNDQILTGGSLKSQPQMIPFSGAIGIAYHKLYDSFMSYKDEVSMTLELDSKDKIAIQFKGILKKLKKDKEIQDYYDNIGNLSDDDVVKLIKAGLSNSKD